MPIYKALILNKEISLNYEENQKDKLVEIVEEVNSKLKSYDNSKSKISDNKLLSFLAIKLQAEIFELVEKQKSENSLEKKIEFTNNENIGLNDKILKLRQQNTLLKNENESIINEINTIKYQIELIIDLVKKTYEE